MGQRHRNKGSLALRGASMTVDWRARSSCCRALIGILALGVVWSTKAQAIDTGFDPKRHGFSFPNANWGQVCLGISSDLCCTYDTHGEFCGSDWGMCGGMSWVAGRRFAGGLESYTKTQPEMRKEIIDAQCDILGPVNTAKLIDWIAARMSLICSGGIQSDT